MIHTNPTIINEAHRFPPAKSHPRARVWRRLSTSCFQAGLAMLVAIVAAAGVPASAQELSVNFEKHPIDVNSEVHQGGETFHVAFRDLVTFPGAPWMRLHIADYELGAHSFVMVRSPFDGSEHRLDAVSLPLWQNATAVFNGDALEIELHVAPDDNDVFVRFDKVSVGNPDVFAVQSICGSTDNRVDSTDFRVGRLYGGGCTAWFITNGAFLTAGHCVDTNRNAAGNAIPDGVSDLTGVVEFNVPSSTAQGRPVAAPVNDQFPIQTATLNWMFDGVSSVGEDWAVFEVGPNPLGQMPWERYNTVGLRPSRENPAVDDNIRVTGYGVDNTPAGPGGAGAPCCRRDSSNNCTFDCNADNFTNQRHTGPYVAQVVTDSNRIALQYQTDTEPANSGSPVIWLTPSPDVAIGIHTSGGCTTSSSSKNQGTAFEVNALEIAIRSVTGSNARFVDPGHPLPNGVIADGRIFRPFPTMAQALTDVPNGGIISVVKGSYPIFNAGIDGKAMLIEAPVGTVTFGN